MKKKRIKKNHLNIKWLSTERTSGQNEKNKKLENGRSSFCHDLGAIIHHLEFRKLSKITQVYVDPGHRVRSRLTHSLEVSNIALQLVRNFSLKCIEHFNKEKSYSELAYFKLSQDLADVTFASCISHDIGHPPFAHAGEKSLENDSKIKRIFDSNVNNLRILHGMTPTTKNLDLTFAIIDSSLKKKNSYPFYCESFNSEESLKLDKISTENNTFIFGKDLKSKLGNKLFKKYIEMFEDSSMNEKIYLRHPIAYLMEAADDISYISSDVDDAINVGSLRLNEFYESFEKEFKNKFKLKDSENKKTSIRLIKPSKIKACIIRAMMENMTSTLNKLFKFIKKEEQDRNEKTLDIVNDFPFIFFKFVLNESMNESKFDERSKKEFGNFAYLGDHGLQFYKLKKHTQDYIFTSSSVVESNEKAKKVIETICRNLFSAKRDKNYSSNIEKISGYLSGFGEEWRGSLLACLKKESKSMYLDIENILIDFISSLTDKEAEKLAHYLDSSFYFKKSA